VVEPIKKYFFTLELFSYIIILLYEYLSFNFIHILFLKIQEKVKQLKLLLKNFLKSKKIVESK
jgi:hypothetical protein